MDRNNSGDGNGAQRYRAVRFMKCEHNVSKVPEFHFVNDGCLAFDKSGPVETKESFRSYNCQCHISWHRKVVLSYYPIDNIPLYCVTTAVALLASPLPPHPLKLPLPPLVVTSSKREIGDQNKPPKKHRISVYAVGASSSSSMSNISG